MKSCSFSSDIFGLFSIPYCTCRRKCNIWSNKLTTFTLGGGYRPGVKLTFILALGGIGGGGLDDMVLMLCCVLCCLLCCAFQIGLGMP